MKVQIRIIYFKTIQSYIANFKVNISNMIFIIINESHTIFIINTLSKFN